MELTTINLTPADALLFIQYQKRYAFMKLLEDVGAFDIRSGSIEVHFDNLGGIAKVDVHKHFKV